MRSVVVAKFVPWPPNSGDKRRTLGIVRALRRRGPVTLCAFTSENEDAGPLRDEGIDVRGVPLVRRPVDVACGLVRARSLTAARFWDPRLRQAVVDAVQPTPDALVIEHVQLLPYADGLTAHRTAVDMHNVESHLTRRMADSSTGLRRLVFAAEARALQRVERRVAGIDVVAVVSEADRRTLSRVVSHPGGVVVVPNAWDDVAPLPPPTGRSPVSSRSCPGGPTSMQLRGSPGRCGRGWWHRSPAPICNWWAAIPPRRCAGSRRQGWR